MKLDEFDYHLPPGLIAQAPAKRRDHSRLLVLEKSSGKLSHSIFHQLGRHLPSRCLLVLNDTRVIPACLQGHKEPGKGKLELLLVHRQAPDCWTVLIKGKVKEGQHFNIRDNLRGEILAREENGRWRVKFQYQGCWEEILEQAGQVPLPPYIKGRRADDAIRYQTVYARRPGAVAAPTAGLHFTPRLLEQLQASGVELAWVTLNVGPGTFTPIRTQRIQQHRMQAEYYLIEPETIRQLAQARRQQRKIVAVGTTTTRALESAADEQGRISTPSGWTDIFIYPGYRFKITDGLLTNFHLPASTPLLMACAFAGRERLLDAYRRAIAARYRFYSYGDAMLIL